MKTFSKKGGLTPKLSPEYAPSSISTQDSFAKEFIVKKSFNFD